ncbi:RNA methyltransferase [Afipia carboxidovorans]|uniref:class I SAM-dependent RNA methyltransferase n=1 Tax=Afipia carboxidovorans TaxID=40137 RepID=UPI00308C3E83|nr:methyltransferase [Afipia carboxidovorans]
MSLERLTIDHVGQQGDGVSFDSGHALYVPYTLPNEVVDVTSSPGVQADRRELVNVVTPSTERIAPFCTYFGICGGCAIQHWQEDFYRAWKRQLVVDTLKQAGLACEVGELIDAHGTGRRRATFHARQGSGALRVGFAAAGRHEIVAIDRCPILDPAMEGALAAANAIAQLLKPVGKPLDIQVNATENGLDIDVRGSGPLDTAILTKLSALADQHRLARLTRHGELVLLRAPPTIRVGRAGVTLPPASFMQPTQAGEETLAALVIQRCKGAKRIADLFCGFGPFALRLAEKFRVAAFDSDGKAIDALNNAVRATQGLKPLTAAARDLFRRPLVPQELREFDCVVFDPPRQGAEAQSRQLAASRLSRVVAVSCNPATFARDARILTGGGFRLASVSPVDQFRHTAHVELVADFIR